MAQVKRAKCFLSDKQGSAMKLNCFILFFFITLLQLQAQGHPFDLEKFNNAAVSGNETAQAMFYEVAGLVCMQAAHAQAVHFWKNANGVTGNAMQALKQGCLSGGLLRFDINFSTPGRYALWLLGEKARDQAHHRGNRVSVFLDRNLSPNADPTAPDYLDTLEDRNGRKLLRDRGPHSEISLGANYISRWFSGQEDGNSPKYWKVTSPGVHHLELVTGTEWGFVIDKIVLTLDNRQPPQGLGPSETTSPDAQQPLPGFDKNVVLPPAWAFGFIYGNYAEQDSVIADVERFIAEDYPIDAYWIDSWFWDWGGNGPKGYLDFVGDREAFPDPKAMWNVLKSKKVKAGIWIWHKILRDGQEEHYAEFRDKGFLKEIETPDPNGWHNKPKKTESGVFDFENPGCVNLFKKKIQPLFNDGLDFFKLDGSTWLPAMKTMFECTQELGKESKGRGFIMTHKTGVENPEYKRYPVKWSSDTKAAWSTPHWPNYTDEWSHGGFKENVEMVANPRLYTYDIPFLTHDGMGFKEFDSRDMDDEYYSRYCQFGCFNSIFEVFSSMTNPRHNFPFKMGKQAQENFRTYTHLRMRLFPYIYTHAHLTRQTGQKMVQGDGVHLTQYRFGDAFLVAPVLQKWARTVEVWLPEGDLWIDYWTDEIYDGGQPVTVAAPVDQLPLFVRAGSIIPMRDYARAIELGSNENLTLEIYPHDHSSFTLYEDDGSSNDYFTGGFACTTFLCSEQQDAVIFTIQPMTGVYNGAPNQRSYDLVFHIDQQPLWASINGETVTELQFDPAKKTATLSLTHRTQDKVKVVLQFKQ